MKPTEQEIQERAREIADRPYFPVPLDRDPLYSASATNGITIRFELMRTAMGGICANEKPYSDLGFASVVSNITNALLLEMARQELGVGDE
jgi:hypothetical protein